MQALPQSASNLVAFPRADKRTALGTAVKYHRLPESLGQALLRDAAQYPDVRPEAALTFAIARRFRARPIDLENSSGILLVGPGGAGKSAVAAKIAHAAALIGRKVDIARADDALALFRTRSVRESGSDNKTSSCSPDRLTVMEAHGFNPLNVRAAAAFGALGEIDGVEMIGVVSALNDAEDLSDLVSAFRFRRVIVTHLDLTRRLGAALAAAIAAGELAHVTRGPHPEDGLDMLTPSALAAQMLATVPH